MTLLCREVGGVSASSCREDERTDPEPGARVEQYDCHRVSNPRTPTRSCTCLLAKFSRRRQAVYLFCDVLQEQRGGGAGAGRQQLRPPHHLRAGRRLPSAARTGHVSTLLSHVISM